MIKTGDIGISSMRNIFQSQIFVFKLITFKNITYCVSFLKNNSLCHC